MKTVAGLVAAMQNWIRASSLTAAQTTRFTTYTHDAVERIVREALPKSLLETITLQMRPKTPWTGALTTGVGALTGVYQYRVGVYDPGSLDATTPGDAQTITLAGTGCTIAMTGITLTATQSVRVYRTKAGGDIFYLLTTGTAGATTAIVDAAADTTLTVPLEEAASATLSLPTRFIVLAGSPRYDSREYGELQEVTADEARRLRSPYLLTRRPYVCGVDRMPGSATASATYTGHPQLVLDSEPDEAYLLHVTFYRNPYDATGTSTFVPDIESNLSEAVEAACCATVELKEAHVVNGPAEAWYQRELITMRMNKHSRAGTETPLRRLPTRYPPLAPGEDDEDTSFESIDSEIDLA